MVGVRQQVSLSTFTEFDDDGVAPAGRRTGEIATLFDQLENATRRILAGARRVCQCRVRQFSAASAAS